MSNIPPAPPPPPQGPPPQGPPPQGPPPPPQGPPPGGQYPPQGAPGYPPPAPQGPPPGQPYPPQGGQYPPPGVPAGQAPPLRPDEERLWATLAHAGGIPSNFVAPLIIWLVFKARSRFVDDQAKEALNFQITVAIAFVAAGIVSFLLILIFPPLFFVMWILLPAIFVANLVFGIMGAMAANKGTAYRYPISLRIIK